jgi:D-alanyl-D-alanine carboxypeptidase (penicillin-binding protein 5/6)
MTQAPRRLLAAALLGATAMFGALTPTLASAQVYATPQQSKYAAVVVDAASGEVLYARRADSPRYPASITKVMTLYLTFEALAAGKLSLDDQIVMSPRAAAQPPSKLGVRAGDSISVNDAISALAVKSSNDVSVALAEKIGGTEQRFAALMTLRAQELGMTNTRFTNANGLPDSRQLSTARDIAILSRAVMRDFPQYYGRFGQRTFSWRGGAAMRNHNGLLHRMPGVDGIKTGYTNAAGSNLAASAVRDGRRLIAVMLGGSSSSARDAHVADLLNAGFNVAARRARGETVTLASMFPDNSAPVQMAYNRGSIEQGDSEPRPARVEPNVPARGSPRRRTARSSSRWPKSRPIAVSRPPLKLKRRSWPRKPSAPVTRTRRPRPSSLRPKPKLTSATRTSSSPRLKPRMTSARPRSSSPRPTPKQASAPMI